MTGAMWLKAVDTLNRVVDLADKEGVVFALENLNLPVDHPGVPFALRKTPSFGCGGQPPQFEAESGFISCADWRREPD